MPIEIISNIVPKNSGYFPVTEAIYIKGGYHSVGTLNQRNSIPSGIRATGILVHVQEDGATYTLASGISNTNWQRANLGSSFSGSFSSSSQWVVNHNLGFYPNIQMLDSSGNLLFGQITHDNTSKITVDFNQSYAGSVYCS